MWRPPRDRREGPHHRGRGEPEGTTMKRRRMSVCLLVIPVGATACSPLSAGEGPHEPPFPPRTSGQGVPLVGMTPDGDRFVGTFALERFSATGDEWRAMKVSNGPTLDRDAI